MYVSIAVEPPPTLPLPDLVPRQLGLVAEDVEDEIMPALRNGHDTTAKTATPASSRSAAAACTTPSPPKLSPPQQKLPNAAGGTGSLFPENNLGRRVHSLVLKLTVPRGSLQGDPSRCSKPSVDFRAKVPFCLA